MAIGNIEAGQTGTFVAVYTLNGQPATVPPASVPVWTASDPLVTFATSADGLTTTATVPGSDTVTSVTISVSAQNADGSTATGSITVAVTPAPQVFTFTVTQTA